MALFERTRMDDKYRRAFTATVLTYIATAKELGKDPLKLSKLPLAASIVTGRELSLRLGKTVHKEKDSLFWVSVDPSTGGISGYRFLAPDLSKFRSKLNKQLKEWGKKSDIKKLMTKRAVTAGVVAAVVTAAVIVTIVTLGAAAPAAAGAGTAAAGAGGATAAGAGGAAGAAGAGAGAAGAAGAGTAGAGAASVGTLAAGEALKKASGGALKTALGALTNEAAKGGSLDAMANAAKASVPPDKAAALEAQGQQTAADVEAAEGWTTGQLALYGGLGVVGLGLTGTIIYLMRK